jgi:ribosomal-protein-alanine N-acetyltransferase
MPLPELQTERLALRPVTAVDIDLLHAMWIDPDMRRYLWDDMVIPREMVSEVIESHLTVLEPRGIGFWVVGLGGEAAGFCGFRFLDEGSEIELLFGFQPRYWGRGLATEAARAALEYLWHSTEFQRVFARTDPPNVASVGVLKKLGMARVSTMSPMLTLVLVRPC